MTAAWLALGGNVGDSRTILDRAVTLLCDGIAVRLTARSSDYRTPPWGFKYQPPFINLCIAVETTLSPRELLAHAQAVELQLGRDRAHEKRWGPRTADIDIIAYRQSDDRRTRPDGAASAAVRARLRFVAARGNRARSGDRRAGRAGGRGCCRYRRDRAIAAAAMTGTVFA